MNAQFSITQFKISQPAVLPMFVAAIFMLSGCNETQAPAFPLFGSYFPSWIACAILGIVLAVIARVVLIRIGIDDMLPSRLLVYVCLALTVGLVLSLSLFSY